MELFTFPVSFEIWNIYLAKFVKRYVRYMMNPLTGWLLISTFIGWSQTGTCSRSVRASSGKVSSQVMQATLLDVRST